MLYFNLIINQKVLQGRNKISGEWGHITLPNRTEDEKKYNIKKNL